MTIFAPHLIALPDLFNRGRPGDHPVARDGQHLIVWREFSMRISRLAATLRQRAETRWLLTSDDPLDFAAELFALLHAGKQAVIPPNTRPGTLDALAAAFDARLDTLTVDNASLTDPLAAIDPHRAIIDLYTSGSTGEHKRVRKTLAQFDAEVAVLESLWGEKIGAAAILATAPHQHIYGLLFRIFWPLASGRIFDAVTCAHPDMLEERLAVFGRAALISSPAQLTRLPDLLPLASLTPKPVAVFSSGGPLPGSAARALADGLGEAPIEVFGSTETGGVAWRQQVGADGDLWTPFPCHPVTASGTGALTLRSPFLADDAPWEMDDGIALMADGRFRLLGRLDRIVKIEEKRLSLPDMESRLLAHAWVDSAAAVALNSRRQSIGAVVILDAEGRAQLQASGKRAVAQALRTHLADHFDAVLLPRHWRFPDQLPTNERGKVAAAALAALFDLPDVVPEPALLPEVTAVNFAGGNRNHVVLDLHVTSDIAHFAGHFPGAALLPGVVQVDWAVHFARRHLPLTGSFSALETLKFLGVILPGTKLQLSLTWDAARQRLEFTYLAYATPQRKYSTGRILFGGAE
jgi:acyl-coenzyme A synthetase/AMP-(fatty) acid ligase/3-hydroxymyristoyl/3-hydroxydecanoyl-(acyl carrier protein) dehydratase